MSCEVWTHQSSFGFCHSAVNDILERNTSQKTNRTMSPMIAPAAVSAIKHCVTRTLSRLVVARKGVREPIRVKLPGERLRTIDWAKPGLIRAEGMPPARPE